MKMLTAERREQAVHYITQEGRPLERALYAYYFAGGSADDVLKELAAFQNDDGGFGHGLEPDFRLNDSSVIATTVGMQYFGDLKTDGDHPMVAKACQYLVNTYNPQTMKWPIIPANSDDAPHAPWWVHDGDLEKSMSNPRAEIAGYLNAYPQHFPDEMREKVTTSVVDYLTSQPDKMEMHDLMCYIRFLENADLEEAAKAILQEKLRRIVNSTVERNPETWKEYGLPPLTLIASPDSPFAADFADTIPQNLDFMIESQSEDGTWKPNWSWFGLWPEEWEQAKRDWTSRLTLDNLHRLRSFGRIE